VYHFLDRRTAQFARKNDSSLLLLFLLVVVVRGILFTHKTEFERTTHEHFSSSLLVSPFENADSPVRAAATSSLL